ncbi:MAG: type II toxin-antitoxin system Phd/YefM family antitoxin [bacterium]
MKQISLAKLEENLAEYIRQAETEDIVIQRGGKPAGVLGGF